MSHGDGGTSITSYVDGLVHPAARGDALARQRHRAFACAGLVSGLIALALVPVILVAGIASTGAEIAALAWLAGPLLAVAILSRTGRLRIARAVSLVALAGLVAHVGWLAGGLSAIVVAGLAILILEAALSGERSTMTLGATLATMVGVSLAGAGALGLAPRADTGPLAVTVMTIAMSGAVAFAWLTAVGLGQAHRDARAATSAEEQRYRLLAENVTDLITRHSRSGVVLFASPAARTLAGVSPDNLMDDGLFARVHVSDRPAYLKSFADAVRIGGTIAVEFRLKVEGAEGPTWRWVEMRIRVVDAAEDARVECVAVTRDIEERRAQEDRLRGANAEAERANEAKTRFLANMSHELRTPLNAIIGFSEMMTHESFKALGEEKTAEYATLINDSGRHLLDVVNGILDMSKIESGSFDITAEPFDVRDLVTNVVALMTPAAEKAGIDLLVQLPADAPELVADRRACKQMLLNLLSNAIKFTDRGGRVTTAVAFDGVNANLSVTDTGIGIADDDLPRLATPFVQAQSNYDRRYEGTGLGLSVVKGLAGLHGGQLLIRSKLGQGTTVTIRLPIEPGLEEAETVVTPFPTARPEIELRPIEKVAAHG